MPIINPNQFDIVDKPELVFGIAAAGGDAIVMYLPSNQHRINYAELHM